MDIWPPPPQVTEHTKTESIQPPSTLVSVALGIPVGLLGGVVVSVVITVIKMMLDGHSMAFKMPTYFYFLALPIEIGLCRVIYSKNKAFALASGIAAACISMILAIVNAMLDGFGGLY